MTQKDALLAAISQINPDSIFDFVDSNGLNGPTNGKKVIEVLSAMVETKNKQAEKAKENRKPSKKRVKNDELAQEIAEYLRNAGQPKTALDIACDLQLFKNQVVGIISAREQFIKAFDGRKVIGWTVRD